VFTDQPMGALTEQRNDVDKFTRAEQDEFAAGSHQKAAAAWKDGVFTDEVVPVMIPQRKGDPIEFTEDEGIRANTTAESLAGLKPAFRKDGTITAGSASQISDGAAAVVVMNKAKAQELGVVVFMHPQGAENVIRKDGLKGRGDLGNIIGNPLETTVFLTHMMFDGTLDRFPGLKICAAHGGGYLPSYLGRTEVACKVRNNADCANKKLPSEYLKKNIMVDTIIISEEGLRHLVAEVGTSQIVYGTDEPFVWPLTLDIILNAPFLSDAQKEAILGGNLVKLLRL